MALTPGVAAWTQGPVKTTASAPSMGQINPYNASAGSLTVTLPALSTVATASGRTMVQKDTLDTSGHTITFNRAGSDQFDDGSTTFTLTAPGEARTLQVVSISGVRRWKITDVIPGSLEDGIDSSGLVVPVKAYGATGNGTTDDTTAIQNAINAASTAGGGVVFFPAGTYKVTTLALKSYVSLRGVGEASVIKTAASSGDMLSYSDASAGLKHVIISDLHLEGPGGGTTANGARLQNLGGGSKPNQNIVFRNLKVYHFNSGHGIEAQALIVSQFDNVVFQNCYEGLILDGATNGACTSVTITACYALSCTTVGFHLKNTYYSTLNSTAADEVGTAYLLENCSGLTLNSPGAEWDVPTGESPCDGFKITGCKNVIVNAARTYANQHYSFWVTGSSTGVVLIAPLEDTPSSATNSLKIDSGSKATVIDKNFTTAVSDAGTTTYLSESVGIFHVDDFGADPTGVSASDTAVAAAITAMGSNPGTLIFGVGTYKLTTTKTLAYPGQGIIGQGAGATTLDWRGSGDCLRMWDSTVPTDGSTSPQQAGPVAGFTIDGTNSSASVASNALHIGDLYGIDIKRVVIKDFNTAGSVGFFGQNRYSWSERANIQMQVDRADICYQFDRHASHPNPESSWDYGIFNLSGVTNANQDCVVVSNNTDMLAVSIVLWCNCHSGVSNNGTLLTIGTTGSDASYIKGHLQVWGEAMGGTGVYHTDINIGAAASLEGVGILQFTTGYPFVAGTASRYNTFFSGRVNTPSLGKMAGGQGLRTTGLLANLSGASDDPSGNPNFYLATGNQFTHTLPNGAATLGFTIASELSGQATTYDLILKQPSSGAAATLTWPGSITWVSGNTPVLSTANNATDHIRLVTTDHTTFYGVHLKQGTQFVTEYTGTTSVSGVAVPAGVKTARVTMIAPGAGGGSGRRGAAATVRCGGGSGGASGAIYDFPVPASALGSTYSVTIPAAGAGGAAVTANDTNGNAGTRPSSTSFTSGSATITAASGDAGGGGTNASGSGGVFAGGGFASSGPLGVSASATGGAGSSGNDSHFAAPAVGGSGGGITSGNAAGAGGAGGTVWEPFNLSGGSGGVVGGVSPTSGAAAVAGQAGPGAGGGAASITGAAQAGANATGYGAGGSGGGASLNGNNSGKGGDGGPGYVRIVWEF